MANLNGFDARKVEPATSFDPLPAGRYTASIIKSEMKPTKNGSGSYLELTFQIAAGSFKGRQVWARLNLVNPNPTAVKIAKGELSAICRAVGVMTPTDSVQLHNLPLEIKVTCKKRDDTGDITNEVKGYYPRGSQSQGATAPAPQAPQPQAPVQQPQQQQVQTAQPAAAGTPAPQGMPQRPVDNNGDIAPWA